MDAPRHPGWPVVLRFGRVELRPLRYRDAQVWSRLRIANEQWLRPWEPSSQQSWATRHSVSAFWTMMARLRPQIRAGVTLPFAVTFDGELVGQLTVSNVVRGVLRSAQIGYWIDEGVAGNGIMTAALALAVDHCFGPVGLHRIQVDIRPENARSRRVVEKLGFRQEALFSRYLDIDGAYRDHIGYALTIEDCQRPLVARLPRDKLM
jgi:ribosomal-protein-alanine N-acetyltransferase